MTETAGIFAAIASLVAAGAGFLLVVRNARTKGRRGAIEEADALETELVECREARLALRRELFGARETLADHGIES